MSRSTSVTKLTGRFLFLLRHEQFASGAITDTHALAQRAQLRIILFITPNIQERLAVLQLEVVILCKTVEKLALHLKSSRRRLTLGKLPKEQRILEPLRRPLP